MSSGVESSGVESVEDRLARLEKQVAELQRHLGLDAAPAGSGPAGSGLAGSGLVGSGPAGSGLAGSAPVGSASAGSGSVGSGPARRPLPPEFHAALRDGKTIKAIKIYRQVTGASLVVAKRAVEDIQRRSAPER
ncbi:hypothetical protein [Nonomuraea sp. NPDC050783]|uniref:hypothetical protein n=1 Tax=Nonomuraea sp. NPDC050783 TaxID=3154634 RepID=UPI00346784C0